MALKCTGASKNCQKIRKLLEILGQYVLQCLLNTQKALDDHFLPTFCLYYPHLLFFVAVFINILCLIFH